MREKKLYLGIVLIMCILSFVGCGNRNGDQSVPITTSSDTSVSTVEVSDEKFKSLFTSTNSSFGITTSGSLYSWGSNDEGCLGLNSSESTIPTPTKVSLPEKILDLAPGVFSVALTESGKVYTWGITSFGIEGVGRTYESNPQELIMPEKISKIFNGHGSIGLAQGESGSLYVWGWNLQGELGNGTTEHSMSPQKIELPSNVIDASCYDTHVLALCQNGKIYSWGSNYFGELGDGKEITIQETGELLENNRLKPEEVLLDESIISIAAGRGASYALSKNGDLYAWGSNDVGQLGTGNMDQLYSSTPIKIEIGSKITSISVGAFHAFAITENGDVYGWGYNSREGQSISVLGIDTSDLIVYSPTKITFIEPIKSISTGAAHTFAYTASEKILSWGSNSDSKISKDLPELINSPMEVEIVTSSEQEIDMKSDSMDIEEITVPQFEQMAVTNAFWLENQVILCYQGLEDLESAKIISYGIESKLSETLYETGYMNFTDMQVQIDENDILLNVDGMNLTFTKDPIRLKNEIPSLSNEMDLWTIGNGHSLHRNEAGQITITNNYTAKTFSLEPSYTFTNSFTIREDQQEMMMLGAYEDVILVGLHENEIGITTLNKEDGILWPEGFVDHLKVQYCDRANNLMIQTICETGGIYQFYDMNSKTLLSQYPFDDGYVAGFVGDTILLSPDNKKIVAYNYRTNQEKILFESNEPSSFGCLDSEAKRIIFDILQYDEKVEQHLYIGTFNEQVIGSKINLEEKEFLSQYDEIILPNTEVSEIIKVLTTDGELLKEWQVDAMMDKGYSTEEIQEMSYEEVYSITTQGMNAEQLEAYQEALEE